MIAVALPTPRPREAQRIVEAMDEILQVRLNRIAKGFDLAAELTAPAGEARDAVFHFLAQAQKRSTHEGRIANLAKAGGALLTLLEVEIERAEQDRLERGAPLLAATSQPEELLP